MKRDHGYQSRNELRDEINGGWRNTYPSTDVKGTLRASAALRFSLGLRPSLDVGFCLRTVKLAQTSLHPLDRRPLS